MVELEFPRVERPIVSIVMLTHDDIEWVPRALRACLDNTDACYELIVVDNGSTDGTKEFLTTAVGGVRVLLNDRNFGYGVSNNLGASYAVGRHLFFLNSDAFVHRDWLPPLLATLEADETVAAIGPRLLNLDGSLQLAGALLTRAGATAIYGEDDDPERPAYTFARDIDFAAGAGLLVRRSAFNEVGGFDPAFGLIYFEDADLCLALWRLGHRIVYEPRSTVTHVGGGGTGPGEAVMRLALRNRSLFERRWRPLLASYPLAPLVGGRRVLAARDMRSSDRILVLEDTPSADAIASTFPSARVTLAPIDQDRLARLGADVEGAADVEEVLRERRFHYDAVVGPASALERFDRLLEQAQPQAIRIRAEDVLDRRGHVSLQSLIEAAAQAGIASGPPALPRASLS